MKGLLLKDFYLISKYCRAFLFIMAVFIGVSFLGEGNLFFAFYPCIISGMLPMTLIAYDERDNWNAYAGGLPYTKAQMVSVKYLIGLSTSTLVLTAVAITEACRMVSDQSFLLSSYLIFLMTLLSICLLVPALMLPFVFKFGAEKGRIIYYVVIIIACAGSALLTSRDKTSPFLLSKTGMGCAFVICFASVLLYCISWLLSIYFYKRREV